MKDFKYLWILGLLFTGLIILVPVVLALRPEAEAEDDPWANLPEEVEHTSHADLFDGPFTTGSEVTLACLNCHPDAAQQVMKTNHWTWQAPAAVVSWREEPVSTGKANVLNNFCIGIQSNWPGCTKCHAGYGWDSADFDFTVAANVDCLVCHDQSGMYVKDDAGLPAEGVDLLAVAESVGVPTRQNCGGCHFNGGGGNAVKHGDMDTSLYFPSEEQDVHMGRHDFQCTDCHQTHNHEISGRSISVSVDNANQIYCTNCHDAEIIHSDARIVSHLDTVACQTCHVPAGATREPTKVYWDWSAAGEDWPENQHEYLKIKGSFVYESDIMPEYTWFNGVLASRYLLGDVIDPTAPTVMNIPAGSITDLNAKIFPFKIHYAKQIYDTVNNTLIQPKTVGEGGYWTEFDWDQAAQLGMEAVGLPYSGEYGFAETEMYWTLSHMVVPADQALQCADCHSDNGRMDWAALGYYGDPMRWGGRAGQFAMEK